MGGGASSVLFVDERNKAGSVGFSRNMFNPQEWVCLQKLCIEKDITQIDLNRVFNKYCTDENAVLRKMRVDLVFFKNLFVEHCQVNKELVDVLVPQVFMRDHEELLPPYSSEEVSFARFMVMGYMFCAQPIQDMIYDLISISRNNPKIQLKAVMYTYNLEQMISILSEDTEKSAALDYCRKRASVQNDMEISIEHVMRICMKYPIGCYQLIRFRQKFRRCILGDRFWIGRPYLESRYFEFGDGCSFESEQRALLETARAIVLDFELGTPKSLYCTNELRFESDDYVVSTEACTRLKSSVGYRAARQLILETRFKYEDSQFFMAIPVDHAETVRAYDAKIKKEFMYNYTSGFRSWIETYRSTNGTVVREECFRTDAKHLVHFENQSDESDDEEGSYYSYDDFSSIGTRSVRSKATKTVKSRASRARRKNTNSTMASNTVITAATPQVPLQIMF